MKYQTTKKVLLIGGASLAVIGGVLLLSPSRENGRPLISLTPLAPKICYQDDITSTEVLRLTNAERIKVGLSPLVENVQLNQVAQLKAQDMIKIHYWSHISPTGVDPYYWFDLVGYPYRYAGENLAEGYRNSKEVITAWLASPGHRANLLNPNYIEVGTTVVCGVTDKNTTLVVSEYGSKQ